MFKRVLIVLLLVVAVVGWGLLALSVHVVRTPEAVVVVPKDRVGWAGTWVDVRGWSAAEAEASPVTRRLIETGKRRHLAHVDGFESSVSRDPTGRRSGVQAVD